MGNFSEQVWGPLRERHHWFQLIYLTGPWTNARPKTLRWAILHAPGRLVHRARQRIVRIAEGWPTADVILGAYQRIDLIT